MMRKTRVSILTLGAVAALGIALAESGCSEESTPPAGSSTGGSNASGGTSTSTSGGTSSSSTGGVASTTGGSSATSGGTSSAGASGSDLCSGSICASASISNAATCTEACACNTCGPHRLGTRNCACNSGAYACSSCDYTQSLSNPIIAQPTAPLPSCAQNDSTTEASTDCGTAVDNGYRCQSLDSTSRICACWNNAWDCASRPGFWTAVTGSGGTSGVGGSSSTGGTATTGGTDTGSGGAETAGGASSLLLCSGVACAADSISTGSTACTAECTCNTCGIQRLGTRSCACTAALYQCTSCQYAEALAAQNPIVAQPTAALLACDQADTAMEARTDCGTTIENGYRCQSQGSTTRICACWNGNWDCGSQPSFWTAP